MVDTAPSIGEAAPTPARTAGQPPPDERFAHRGPIQRILVRPEIGAAIGALAVWSLFWAVTIPFGTAAGTANYLDVAATLGIMAVAVSLLMIGGEFDLSAGAMTGATGILVILLVKETGEIGGAGLSLWVALPVSFVLALSVGWFNGTMVERTALPSFIVTLGTFFMLRGAKLGLSKLFVDSVQVGSIEEGAGYDFWRKVFASVWVRNDHVWEIRDTVFTVLFLLGVAAVLFGILEQAFVRRRPLDRGGLVVEIVGVAVGLAGFVGLLVSDGIGANVLWGVVTAVGFLVALVGMGRWRFDRAPADSGPTVPSPAVLRNAGFGIALVAAGSVFGFVLDSDDDSDLIFLLTTQGLRAVLFVGLALAGLVLLIVATSQAGKQSRRAQFFVGTVTAVVIVGFAFVVRAQSESPKFRAELFTVLLAVAALTLGAVLMTLLFERRTGPDPSADRWGRITVVTGAVLVFVAVAIKLLFATEEEVATSPAVISFRISILWFLIVAAVGSWLLMRAKFGSWIFAVGGNKAAARQVGVPAARTKTTLFMMVTACAWLVGMLLAFRLTTLQAATGDGLEFEFIIAAVVGGNLLTGGYGSAAGAAIGALIMAMSEQGIPFAGWNSNWRFVFLGVILLLAVILNNFVRKKAEESR